ncbi:MAG TPA: GNAT family N-acetyltransferase [Acidimicrobiia bacterium]|nr:GNAT family N-acetyltransferase [Acidimicrobiia bacterium]
MPRVRLGVALLVPEPVRTEIEAMRRALGDGSLDRVPAHVTLVPPVNVHERDLDAVFSLLRDAAAASASLTLDLGPPTTFLPDNPVLFLAVAGDLAGLERLRQAVFVPPLHRELAWPYVPHVTLSEQDDPERVAAGALALADYRALVTIDRVHLLREVDQRWVPFADAALGGRRVVARGGLELEIVEAAGLEPPVRRWLDRQWARHGEAVGRAWDERGLTLTARRGGVVVGAATGWTNEGVGHLSELVVDADVRGEGVGAHLLAAFEDAARGLGVRWLTLRTDAGSPAEGFYARRGWVLTGTLEDWVAGRTMSEMRKDL